MNKIKKCKVQIVAPISPYKEFGGGIVTSMSNIVNQLGQEINFRLIGVNFENDKNNRCKLHKVDFLSVANLKLKHIKNKSSVLFAFGIYKNKFEIDKNKSIFHVQRTDSALPLLYPVRTNNPVIVHIRGSNTYWKYLNKGIVFRHLVNFVEHLVIKKADKIIMVSKKALDEYHDIYPKYKDKIIYIPNGININKFYPIENKNLIKKEYNIPEDKKVILYTGRFVREKGINLLLKSFEKINEHMTNFLFVLVGDGPLKPKIYELSRKYSNVQLLSPVTNDQMPNVYNFADVLVMASYFEGWSNTMGEALACGVPVVTTNVGDAEELIQDGKNGYIVYDRDPNNFADECILAINHCDEMRKYARDSVIPYSLENMASKLKKIYYGLSQ